MKKKRTIRTKTFENGVYVGVFFNDLKDGYGTYKWSNGDCYEGQ